MCLECRKARSRVAAQSRREKESQLLRELAALLPLAPSEADQLDKASVIRVTISYLHLRALLDIPDSTTVGAMMHPVSASQGELPESIEKWFLDTLEGFLLLLSLCGKIIFITKDAVSHIGIKQMDLIGRSLFDFIHPSDHKEIKEILTRIIGSEDQQKCEVFFRIKGAVKNMLTPWQVIHCTGNKKSSPIPGSSYLLLLCRSLPVQEVIEMEAHLNFKTFLSIHEPDMKFTYCHSGVLELTGFSDVELYGQSVYQYYHPSDCQHIFKAHLFLFSKGQVYTGKYRLLQKHGGYVWVETDATVVFNIHTGDPERIVCINYILSGVELPDVVFSLEQTKCLLNAFHPPYTTMTHNETTSTTTDMDTSFVASPCERDKPTNSCTEILHRAALCGSLSNDMYDLDLDSLAPYIPTHEEDFHLTPILDGMASDSVLNRHLRSLNETWLTLDSELPTDSETVFSHRLNMNKNPMLVSSSQWHDSTYTMNKKQQVRFKRQISIPEKKTNHWTDVSQHLAKTFSENFVWNCSQSYAEPVHLAYKYAKLSWCPPGSSTQHSNQNTEGKMPSVLVNLPVLSRWECEVNAPLGPTSHLLQGTELITVLDQVASGLCCDDCW
ncbi:hypoxia inducible factor 1 subunit alpha, like 2 isoform X2 [Ictalurus furcatus]|uniref:hypoxia inducible factor 1 subunit alpha, like 2 isoform X2 n=2 Tax=Ictalurus furcatus TaxID=66913 RepID=UPI00234FF1C5|nr:hypoxia inducible factor 1 subunit alpha, like 2 isoform X2 [Ictalurus furcatus]